MFSRRVRKRAHEKGLLFKDKKSSKLMAKVTWGHGQRLNETVEPDISLNTRTSLTPDQR